MNLSRRILPLFVLILVTPVLRAQDETIPDPRLEQKVTYAAYGSPLQTVTDELAKKTGVSLKAGSGERDWRTKERKVHIVLQDLPLGTALKQIAQTLGYELRRSGGEGKWSYRIWQAARSRDYEETMRISQTEQADREIVELRKSIMSDAESASAMSPEEALQLREKDPWRAYLGGTESGRAYSQILRGLPEETRELMLRGRKVSLEGEEMSPDDRAAMVKMVDTWVRKTGNPQVIEAMKGVTPARIVFQPLTPETNVGGAGGAGFAGMAWVMGDPKDPSAHPNDGMENSPFAGLGKGAPLIALPLTGADSMMGRVFGNMLLRMDAGEKMEDIQRDMIGQMQQAQAQGEGQLRKIQPTPKPTDPALLVEIDPFTLKLDLARNDSQTSELLKQLMKKTKLSFIVEFYPEEIPVATVLPAQKEPLYKLLDRLQLANLSWEYEKGVVRIRPKDWAVQRSYDVPESFLARYRAILTDKGWFDLDTLGEISAALTDGQLQRRFIQDPELRATSVGLVAFGVGSRGLLRFYGELTPDQKAQIKSEPGLSFDRLNEAQWQRLASVIEDATQGEEIRNGRIRLEVDEGAEAFGPSRPPSSDADKPKETDKPDTTSPTRAEGKETTTPDKPAEKENSTTTKSEKTPGEAAKKAEEKDAPENAPPTGPMFHRATFRIEMESDSGDKPITFRRNLMVPTRAQIAQMKKTYQDLNPKKEVKPGDNPTKIEDKK